MVPIQVPSAWPALVRTGSQMAQYGTTLALVGGTFATVDVSRFVRPGIVLRLKGQYGTTLALVGGTFATVDVSGSQ